MSKGWYVYAVVKRGTPLPAGVIGLNDSMLEILPCGDLATIASALSYDELHPSVDAVMCHETVVEAVRELGPALPVRFGTLLADAAAVEREIGNRHDMLASDLARLGDTFEYGLVVLWQPPEQENAEPSDSATYHHVSGAGYLRAKSSEYRRLSARRARAEALAKELSAVLGPRVLDERTDILPTERMVVRAAYLVTSRSVEQLYAGFDELRRVHPELRMVLSGPWPPYSFVTVPVTAAEGAAAGSRA